MIKKTAKLGLMVGALGVVYGDIGTSPLYVMSETFFGHYDMERSPENILGVLSLIFWSLMMVVTVKYVMLIMKADNGGEGGIFALLGLFVKRSKASPAADANEAESSGKKNAAKSNSIFKKKVVIPEGKSAAETVHPFLKSMVTIAILIGAALLYGDGMITPAISVLSAVEGLKIIAPGAKDLVIPLTILILLALFAIQKYGTHKIGWLFGPAMVVWFATIAVLGVLNVVQRPAILAAFNPIYAAALIKAHSYHSAFILGAVVLCVTGVEAMYADMGHFGRGVIAKAWLFMVLPCLCLNYFGQGAVLLSGKAIAENHVFYSLAPSWALIPVVIIATIATVIASQALISGAFSLTQQAMALGLFPRLKIIHTNSEIKGQIYLPFINGVLFIGCIWLVFAFKNSGALAAAYGIAVTGTMVVTTFAFAVIARTVWHWKLRILLPIIIPIFIVDLSFFGANMVKFVDGGYVPVVIGLGVFIIMDTWRFGRAWIGKMYQKRQPGYNLTVKEIIEHKPQYLDMGNSVSLVVMASRPINNKEDTVPPVMAEHYHNWKRLPKHLIFLSIIQTGSPYVAEEERYKIITFSQDGYGTVVSVQGYYGYMEQPNIRKSLLDLKLSHRIKIPNEPKKWLILIGSERIVSKGNGIIEQLRVSLFSRMNRLAKPITDYFGLETDSGVTMETINV